LPNSSTISTELGCFSIFLLFKKTGSDIIFTPFNVNSYALL
jgi:hypothetical protein